MHQPTSVKLSICIPTYNRATFLAQALESIISQVTDDCEIIVSDNASSDGTKKVVADYAYRCQTLSYIRNDTNIGVDRNCNRAVECASGEYCWLFSDDDLMKPGAIATILEALQQGHSLVLVNAEHRDLTMSRVLVPNFFGMISDRVYFPTDYDRMFIDIGMCVMCICCVIIKRDLWMERERQRYYGSWFLHTAVVFQKPLPGTTLVLARPLTSLRLGNEQTHAGSFRVWHMLWPALIWSFPLEESTKRKFCAPEPWRRGMYLLALRALGLYVHADYLQWLRPNFGGSRKLFPLSIVLLPKVIAFCLYRIGSLSLGGSKSPHDVVWTMRPKSLRVLISTFTRGVDDESATVRGDRSPRHRRDGNLRSKRRWKWPAWKGK